MATADDESTSLRRFKGYRDGLLIGLLAIRPLRLRNLAGLILDRTLVQRGDGWWIQIPAAETKTKDPIEEPWPEMLVPHLQTYLADHLSGIAALRGSRKGASSDALWLSMYGPPMTDNGIYDRSVTRTRDGLGQPINPHLFRDCAAKRRDRRPCPHWYCRPSARSSHRIDDRTLLQPSARGRRSKRAASCKTIF
jgi:hypothetical protein